MADQNVPSKWKKTIVKCPKIGLEVNGFTCRTRALEKDKGVDALCLGEECPIFKEAIDIYNPAKAKKPRPDKHVPEPMENEQVEPEKPEIITCAEPGCDTIVKNKGSRCPSCNCKKRRAEGTFGPKTWKKRPGREKPVPSVAAPKKADGRPAPTPKRPPLDPRVMKEIEAMQQIASALVPLTPEQRDRALGWANDWCRGVEEAG